MSPSAAASSTTLSWVDQVCDYLPGISSLTNAVELVAQSIFKNSHYPQVDSATYRNFSFVYAKDTVRCYFALVPIIGNIILALSDLLRTLCPVEAPATARASAPRLFTEAEVNTRLQESADGLDGFIARASSYMSTLTGLNHDRQAQLRMLESFNDNSDNPFVGIAQHTGVFLPAPLTEDAINTQLQLRAQGIERMIIAAEHYRLRLARLCHMCHMRVADVLKRTDVTPVARTVQAQQNMRRLLLDFLQNKDNPFLNLAECINFFVPTTESEQDRDYVLSTSLARAPSLNTNVIQIVHKILKLMEIKINICEKFAQVQLHGESYKAHFDKAKAALAAAGDSLRTNSDWERQSFLEIVVPVSCTCVYIERNPD